MKALITRKIGMTSAVADDGSLLAMTLLSAEPNVISQIKSIDSDGYQAVQIGALKTKKLGKAQAGHFKGAGMQPKVAREIRIAELPQDLAVGTQLTAEVFSVGDSVHATGVSKGKGFAGTIKRHNFHRGRKTHGGRSYRRPGSIGSMYPQHILKGKRMAGQMGAERVTVRGLKVILVDNDLGLIGVSGAVPGPKQGIVLIREAS